MSADGVPLMDLAADHREVADEIEAGWADVIARTAFIGGAAVEAFESSFARWSGVDHCVGVGNGTDALELALRALGVGPGDECILPANTFVATAEAVARTGARPVLVDCLPDTALIDVDAVPAAVTSRTRAVLPVHLYGQAAAVERLNVGSVAIVEDAAQAQGARRHGVPVGSLGHISGTSFYPGKNLGAYGDAGAVLTDDDDVAQLVRLLRDHGSPRKYEHTIIGANSRLDALQAVVLSAKLARLTQWNAARAAAADRYRDALDGVDGVVTPVVAEGNEPVWHLYVVQVPDRDRVLARLQAAGIGASIHYPVALHLTGAFAHLGYGPGDFPVAEQLASSILSLPLFPSITEQQQMRVVDELAGALDG